MAIATMETVCWRRRRRRRRRRPSNSFPVGGGSGSSHSPCRRRSRDTQPEPPRRSRRRYGGMNKTTLTVAFVVLVLHCKQGGVSCRSIETQGPRFVREPPTEVDFSNSTGRSIDCVAKGVPSPTVEWTRPDGDKVGDVRGLRVALPNGTLFFPPFSAEDYRQDVHASLYACIASNAFGTIVSRDVRVRAVVQQFYEAQVYDEFVILNNTAVMRCQIPSFVHDYVIVTSWIRESSSGVQAVIESGGRFSVFSNGVLHIREANPSDGAPTYRCRTQHRLTGEVRLSTSSGRIIITEPQSSVPPRITHSMGLVEAIQGDAVELPCAAQGFSIPNYSWMKVKDGLFFPLSVDDRLVQMGGNLLLKNVQTTDSGTYVCVVNNSVGVERVETTLFVTAPLALRVHPSVQVVDVGKEAAFTCSVSGHPISSVSWLKDGRPVATDGHLRVAKDTLHLVAVQREDRGMYQCQARNTQMSAQATAELKLGDAAPLLQESFPSVVRDPGQGVSLRCVISGNPPPQVTWSLDDFPLPRIDSFLMVDYVNIHGDVISHVNISRIRTEDGGEYRCIGKNKVGRIEHAARLNITGPPFIRPMANVSVVAGSSAGLTCRVAGHPLESIYWERDGTVLPINHRQKVFSNGTLLVQNVQRAADAGTYTCVAQGVGQTARRNVNLIVLSAPMISPFTFLHNIREGMRAGVTCLITDGDPPIAIQWLKDERPLPAHLSVSTRNIDEYTSTLVIASVSPRHGGNYTCVATNAAATVRFTASLLVNVPPRWLVEPKDTHVIQRETARIECQADGFPTPATKWKRAKGKSPGDYEEIPSSGSGRFGSKNGTLTVRVAEEGDEGYYLCQANNGVGAELSKLIFLDVRVPAYFEQKHRNATCRRWESGRVECEARGDAPVAIAWKLNGVKLDSASDSRISIKETTTPTGTRSELVISRVDRRDFAVFSCIASNSFGSDEAKVQLIVQERPEMPRRLTAVDVGSRRARLSWTPPFDGNSAITRYIVQYKVGEESWSSGAVNVSVPGASAEAEVAEMSPATVYEIRVRAENGVGVGNVSNAVTLTTDEEEPGGVPLETRVEAVSSQALKVVWKPPRKDLWNGKLEGYHVGYRELEVAESFVFKTIDVRKNEYVITDLKKFTRYGVVVAAYNRKGWGPKCPQVTTATLEDVPSQPPADVACSTQSSRSILVTWTPPPPHATHGLLQGYKVFFVPTDDLVLARGEEKESKSTKSERVTLSGLRSYTNYTIHVAAFTRAGDGVRSDKVHCHTKEDVPEPPADIKSLVMSSDAIIVSWLPPKNPNGRIVKYTVFVREIGSHDQGPLAHTLPPSQLHFEARGLKENFHYEFWVTAATEVGEGDKSRVVSQAPLSTVPAKIASFSERHVVPLKSDVKLGCRSVGIPTPDREWRSRGQKLVEGPRTQLASDGSLYLSGVRVLDSGNYTCRVYNIYATDELTHEVLVKADQEKKGPPSVPVAKAVPVGMTSLHVTWRVEDDGGSAVEGFVLNYRREGDTWKDLHLDGHTTNFTLTGLLCGSRYQLYMLAANQLGSSGPGEMVVVSTRGFPPIAPDKEVLFSVNSTCVVLHLDAWMSVDPRTCRVQSITVEYRPYERREWTLVVRSLHVEQKLYVVGDLAPATAYNFRVTAHSDAGIIMMDYDIVTLEQGSISDMTSRNADRNIGFYLDMNIAVPIIVISIVILVLMTTICHFARRRRYTGYKHGSYPAQDSRGDGRGDVSDFEKPPGGGQPLGQTYSPTTTRRLNQANADVSRFSPGGGQDDVCPYATYQLPACITEDDNAVEFQTFRHSGAIAQQTNMPATKIIYSKVKKLRNAQPSETQKNPVTFETPYDEKKTYSAPSCDPPAFSTCDVISMQPYTENPLVPSAPPIDYNCVNSTMYNTKQECGSTPSPMHVEHSMRSKPMRTVPDLLYHRPDSSTSNEGSPDTDHRSSSCASNSRCSTPESTAEETGVGGYSCNLKQPKAFVGNRDVPGEDNGCHENAQKKKNADNEKKRLEANNLAAAEEELIALLKRGSAGKPASHPSKTDFTVRV